MPHAPAALHALRGEIHDFALNRIFAKLGALRAVSHRTTLQTRGKHRNLNVKHTT